MATRRRFGLGIGAALMAGALARRGRAAQADPWPEALGRQFAAIEARCGGRLGVGVLDTGTGRTAGHRGHERFPMCSIHKALSAAAVLARVDRKRTAWTGACASAPTRSCPIRRAQRRTRAAKG